MVTESGPQSDPLRVLVVDDEESMRHFLSRALRRRGFLVEVVTDGEAALAALGGEAFDVMLTDVRMPGMDGMAALRVIHANFSRTRVAMLSSLAGAASKAEEAFRLGAVQVISKPFEPAVLEALFESEREHRRAEGGA